MSFCLKKQFFCLEVGQGGIVDGLYRHALHLHEPSGAAYRRMHNDEGLVGEALCEETAYQVVVGYVAQIDDQHRHVVIGAFCLCQQGLDIVPHTTGLLLLMLAVPEMNT